MLDVGLREEFDMSDVMLSVLFFIMLFVVG